MHELPPLEKAVPDEEAPTEVGASCLDSAGVPLSTVVSRRTEISSALKVSKHVK